MTAPDELLPCPFCGGESEIMTPEDDNMRLATAMCMGCYVTGPERGTEAEASAAWNRRPEVAALVAKARADALPDVDTLAQIIRVVDGRHDLGAGALAEAIIRALSEKEPTDE